jgi:hypothetical protein
MGDASDFHPSESSRGFVYKVGSGTSSVSKGRNTYQYDWTQPWTPYVPPYGSGSITWVTASRCKYCDGKYCKEPEQCPRVKSVSYYKDGSISKIEFHKVED